MHLATGIVVFASLAAIVTAECDRPPAPEVPFPEAQPNITKLPNGRIEIACPNSHMAYGNFGGEGGTLVFEVRGNIHNCDPVTGKYYVNETQESALGTMSCVSNSAIINNKAIGLCTFNSNSVAYLMLNGIRLNCPPGRAVKILAGELKGLSVPYLTCASSTLTTKLENGTKAYLPSLNAECESGSFTRSKRPA